MGFIWIIIHDHFREVRLHINELFVDDKYRGKGIGIALINKAKKAQELGVEAIDLFVSENNAGARGLYKKLGFFTERRYKKNSVIIKNKTSR
jgi:ribosomal protein S18 acetylase RimI-like enzyme